MQLQNDSSESLWNKHPEKPDVRSSCQRLGCLGVRRINTPILKENEKTRSLKVKMTDFVSDFSSDLQNPAFANRNGELQTNMFVQVHIHYKYNKIGKTHIYQANRILPPSLCMPGIVQPPVGVKEQEHDMKETWRPQMCVYVWCCNKDFC